MWVARADLHADSSFLPVGTLTFIQTDILGSSVRVTGKLFNLMPNTRYHGFHVHMFALPNDELDCTKAGDHWNPYGMFFVIFSYNISQHLLRDNTW